MSRMLPLFAVLACLLAVHAAPAVPQITTATCVLRATSFGGAISGSVDFALNGDSSISITTALTNLTIGDSYRISVHTFGTWTADGAGAGDRLGLCTSPCRPFAPTAADRSSAGWLANASWLQTDPNARSASQTFTDNVIQLNGPFSIIGRSIILFNMAGARVAQCAIGRNDNAAVETAAVLVPDSPAEPQRASCRLVGTAAHAPAATGWMKFEMTPAGNMAITYEVSDISSTQPNFGHPIHVHQRGNVADAVTAMQVQGHFNGSCSSCRPVGILQEVGNIGDGYRINVASGATRTAGQLVDSVMTLSGPRSIIGRSVVVHGKTGDPDVPRAAQCVIGIDAPAPAPAAPSFFSSLTWGSILLILVGIAVIFGGIVYAYRRWKHNYASFDSDTEAMARS